MNESKTRPTIGLSQWMVKLGWAFTLTLLVSLDVAAAAAPRPPNVVVILTDDQGWGDLSFNGNSNLQTPRIDSLGRAGASFERFYVSPVCSPTRAEFLTGRYHPRGGVFSTSAGGERLDRDEQTIAEVFKNAGYATGAFGKWHNGMQYPYHPNGRGFDEYYGFCSGHWGDYFDAPLERNGELVTGNGFLADDFTGRTMEFIERNRDQPFFAYLAYNTPHSPMQVPDRFWRDFESKELGKRHRDPEREDVNHTRAALAMCENLDWNIGRLLQRLDELSIAGETIVMFFCDNGPNGFRWNGGLKGRKGSADEGGIRSPLFIRWPGKIEAGRRISQISAAIDLLPTLADLAGIQIASPKPLDGVSLRPLLLGQDAPWNDRMIFSHWNDQVSVGTQRYRLDSQGRLFDLVVDPGQRADVSTEFPAVQTRLAQAAAAWKAELLPGLRESDRPFTVGDEVFRYTQLPARDATAHGNIERSNRFPNCSFFTNWRNTDDYLSWPVEVRFSGNYAVEVYYTCREQDVGSMLELSFKQNSVRGRVTEAHDPPLRGMEHDRVPRQESYVKDFRAMKLGTISLEKGRGDLILRAIEIPREQALDFRLLMLTRVD